LVGGNGIEKSSRRKITDLRMNRICSQKEKNGIPGISPGNAKTIRHIDKGTQRKESFKGMESGENNRKKKGQR